MNGHPTRARYPWREHRSRGRTAPSTSLERELRSDPDARLRDLGAGHLDTVVVGVRDSADRRQRQDLARVFSTGGGAVLASSGSNGGGAMVCARRLHTRHAQVHLFLATAREVRARRPPAAAALPEVQSPPSQRHASIAHPRGDGASLAPAMPPAPPTSPSRHRARRCGDTPAAYSAMSAACRSQVRRTPWRK